ncbi:ribosomal protein S2, flavodoxin-like domain-containing protein [Abortiporus biennis]|nr:ribosomal protein S2, flavodoxin-like domain-containing protein [Abortiporus biennis]
MASIHLRPSLAAFARSSSRFSTKNAAPSIRRCVSTAIPSQEVPLNTVEDWTEFQIERAQYKTLIDHFSEYGSTQTRENTFQPHHTLHRPLHPSEATLSALLAAGAHMGHAKSLMNPNFMPYAYGVRAGITVIDLDHTLPLLRRAAKVVRSVAANDGMVLFVGTRPDLRPVVRKAAERMGAQGFHIGEKWLAGTLTNKLTLFGPDALEKKRVVPDLVVILNPTANLNAIRECAIEHVPTIGIVDSNVDPRVVMYPIPANDESTRTAELIAGVLSVAGREGVAIRREEEERIRIKAEKTAANVQRMKEKFEETPY